MKHNRLFDTRSWLRQLVRPAKSRIEFDKAVALAEREVPTVTPLAVGVRSRVPADSYLVTRAIPGAEPLSTFLEAILPELDRSRQARLRQRLAVALGEFVARLHQCGVVHNDLHAGNLLVRWDADDRPSLYLIDLHTVSLGGPLGWPARRANLILFNRWFVLRAERPDRLRFWRSYCRARGHADTPKSDLARDLEARTWASNLQFWRNRDRRCLVTNRYYYHQRSDTGFGYAVQELDREGFSALLSDPDEPFRRPGLNLLKDSRSSTVAELTMPVAGVSRPVVYKRFRITKRSDPWLSLLRRSAALRSWVFGHGLRERCLPTARPLAVLHRSRRGLPCEGYLLTEKIEGAADLHGCLAKLASLPPPACRQELRRRVEQVARLVRELHRRGLTHRDLKAANLLVTDERVWLIDLVGVARPGRLKRGRKVQNLARLNASFHGFAALTRTDRLRFLRVYLQWGVFGRDRWKAWWRAVELATRAKVARNARSGRPLA